MKILEYCSMSFHDLNLVCFIVITPYLGWIIKSNLGLSSHPEVYYFYLIGIVFFFKLFFLEVNLIEFDQVNQIKE
jgi:predicted branched-subunit amino acid permease